MVSRVLAPFKLSIIILSIMNGFDFFMALSPLLGILSIFTRVFLSPCLDCRSQGYSLLLHLLLNALALALGLAPGQPSYVLGDPGQRTVLQLSTLLRHLLDGRGEK